MGSAIVAWITGVLGAGAGKIVGVIFISMLPVIELRGAIPVAFALGIDWKAAFLYAIIGNLLPIPFILLFLETVFSLMKKYNIFRGFVEKMEKKALTNNKKVTAYKFWGLMLFVAIPLPGTGAWTGALIASVMKMNKKSAFCSIFLGVITAGVVVTLLTYGLIGLLFGAK